VQSNSQAGKLVSIIHMDLVGETSLRFADEILLDVDVIFLCMGHGKSKAFIENNDIPSSVSIIDLSRDFRLKEDGNHFIYGLPELNKSETTIQLALLPLAKAQLLKNEVHVHAITGSTGAGQKPTSTTHFSWRNNNVSIYKAFNHQHLGEIRQSVKQLQSDFDHDINFLPMRGDFPRGIFASVYTHFEGDIAFAKSLYEEYYQDQPFVIISDENPSVKQVVNTNKCILHLEKHDNKLLIISTIDNLIKGASGQAVQNMNLIFGLPETTGLGLKAVAF